jgi:site-specific recombinase XerD
VLPHLGQQGPAVGGGPWLFTALDGQAMTEQSLRQAFAGAFAQYFNYPLHPHAPRHIVVTDLLKADPRNLPIAAILLNEDIKTVRKSYAHLLTQDVYAHFDDFSSQQASDVLGHTVPLVFEESGLPKGRR